MAVTTTAEAALPRPDSGENANVPEDLLALTDRLEEILADGGDGLMWDPGDFKVSAQQVDHGRWLLCDGRDLTQAEIEAALGIAAGKAADFVTALGTGATSLYGSAPVGKVHLPDPRGRALLFAGNGPGLTTRARGASGGAETVTLTGAQSGIKAHSHSASQDAHNHGITDPGHTHGDGTLATDSVAHHSHGDGTYASDVHAGHDHADGTLATSNDGSHQHTGGTLVTDVAQNHGHTADGTLAAALAGAHTHYLENVTTYQMGTGAGGGTIPVLTTATTEDNVVRTVSGGAHAHDVTGDTNYGGNHQHSMASGLSGTSGSHTHDVTGATASGGAHSHDVTGSSGAAGGHSHDVTGETASGTTGVTTQNATPAVTVNTKAAEDAAEAHNNMPPFLALGNAFIRV